MQKISFIIAFVAGIGLIAGVIIFSRNRDTVVIHDVQKEEVLDERLYEIQDGDTIATILGENSNLSDEEVFHATTIIQEVFDVTKIRAGNVVRFLFTQEVFAAAELDIDKETMLTLTKEESEFVADVVPIEYTKVEARTEGVIEDSFYVTGLASGLTDKAILEVARIFSWDIDFTTNIQPGDSFSIIYDNTYRDEEFAGVGDIKAARFINEGNEFYAFRVINKDGTKDYYNEVGESKKRLLLKTPLNYSRVSSKFAYRRKHPISGSFASHRAVDLVAPKGTLIESVGDGVVELAGWNGGYGKYIRVRHDSGLKSAYAHLSSISSGVKKGATVKQGQVIGAVGSTGTSTGPHLHYEVWKNGSPVNPFTVEIPPGEPIDESQRLQLETIIEKHEGQL
jgi:murein DD-endopeptidase MepM/ murein hydrolase activator NlpD